MVISWGTFAGTEAIIGGDIEIKDSRSGIMRTLTFESATLLIKLTFVEDMVPISASCVTNRWLQVILVP